MDRELNIITFDVFSYLVDAWRAVHPLWVAIVSIVSYILFPDDAYIPATIAVGVALGLDILTKYYAIAVNNGGIKKAFKEGKISSNKLWQGTYRKIISYLVVMILCGLSVRVTMLTSVAVFLSTIAYSVMFLREAQSVLENLVEAGHEDLEWFLFFVRKKKKEVLEKENIVDPIEKGIDATKGLDKKSKQDREDYSHLI